MDILSTVEILIIVEVKVWKVARKIRFINILGQLF